MCIRDSFHAEKQNKTGAGKFFCLLRLASRSANIFSLLKKTKLEMSRFWKIQCAFKSTEIWPKSYCILQDQQWCLVDSLKRKRDWVSWETIIKKLKTTWITKNSVFAIMHVFSNNTNCVELRSLGIKYSLLWSILNLLKTIKQKTPQYKGHSQ